MQRFMVARGRRFGVVLTASGCLSCAGGAGGGTGEPAPAAAAAAAAAAVTDAAAGPATAAERITRIEQAQQRVRNAIRQLDQESWQNAQATRADGNRPSVLVQAIPRFIFNEARVQIAPDAAVEMNALTGRAAEAIRSWEANPSAAGVRPPAEVFESTVRLAGAVAQSAGNDDTVTAEEAAAALRGVCPLYPFC